MHLSCFSLFSAAGLSKLPNTNEQPISSEAEEDSSASIETPLHPIDIKPTILPDGPLLDPNQINDSLAARLSLQVSL